MDMHKDLYHIDGIRSLPIKSSIARHGVLAGQIKLIGYYPYKHDDVQPLLNFHTLSNLIFDTPLHLCYNNVSSVQAILETVLFPAKCLMCIRC